MRQTFILNTPAQQKSGVVLACVAFVLRDSLLSSSLQKGDFLRLLIDSSVVVKVMSWEANGWALAEE